MQDETPDVYANTAQFSIGVYDFTIDFGIQDALKSPSDRPAARTLVRVRMSPQHAAALAKTFAAAVEKYEDQMGKINLPPSVLEEIGAQP